uniref:Uncharacterized protein n=1 Tax=Panagrolaimus sp. ES5 TaxID=591445 RepID=A0AC34GYF1_9BILA
MVKLIIAFFVSSFVGIANCGWTGAPFTGPPPTGMFPMGRKGGAEGGRPTGILFMGRGSPPTGPPPLSMMKNGVRPSGLPPPNTGMTPTGIAPSGMTPQNEAEIRQKRQQPPFDQQQSNEGSNFGNDNIPPFVRNHENGMNGNNQFESQGGFNGQQSGGYQGYPQQLQQERSLPTEYGQYNKKRSLPTQYGQYRRK